MMRAAYIRALAAIIGLSGPVAHFPQSAAELPASTLPDAYAGLSPSAARELRAQIQRLARERDVREATLVAIAARLRVDYQETSFATLLEVLDNRAVEAEQLRAELSTLRSRFELIPARLDREAAQDLLSRANAALDAGELELADQLLAELTPLRGGQVRVGLDNWEQVVAARARVLVLSGRVAESLSYRREASRALDELTRMTRFRLMHQAAVDAYDEGARLPGLDLLQAAIDAYIYDVLPLTSRADSPFGWAMVQNNIGIALYAQGERIGGEAGAILIARAAEAFEAALQVFTRETSPADWAMAQVHLGSVLRIQAERAGGKAGVELLERSIARYEAALKVYTKDETPYDWAWTQLNLGNSLSSLAKVTGGDKGISLLILAIDCYQAALEVHTKQAMPSVWATTQTNLGSAFLLKGMKTQGASGTALLVRAVEAFEASLDVRTQAERPADWAMTQVNLGTALQAQAERNGGTVGRELLERAVSAFEAALEVRTQTGMPADWATTQVKLGNALTAQAQETGGAAGVILLKRAIASFEVALKVRTQKDMPVEWAATQNNLGLALVALGDQKNGVSGTALLARASAVFEASLLVYTQKAMPGEWGITQLLLADVNYSLWKRAQAPSEKRVRAQKALEYYTHAKSVFGEDINYARQIEAAEEPLRVWLANNPQE